MFKKVRIQASILLIVFFMSSVVFAAFNLSGFEITEYGTIANPLLIEQGKDNGQITVVFSGNGNSSLAMTAPSKIIIDENGSIRFEGTQSVFKNGNTLSLILNVEANSSAPPIQLNPIDLKPQITLPSGGQGISWANGFPNEVLLYIEVVQANKILPTITTPEDFFVEATGSGGAIVDFNVSASDNEGNPVLAVSNPSSGSLFPIGETIVQVVATDSTGSSTTKNFKITVRDTTAPKLSIPADIVVEASSSQGAEVHFEITAIDLVDGSVDISANPNSGSHFGFGTTTVNVTAADKAGNFANGSFKIIVEKREIIIAAENKTKIYGDDDEALSYIITSGELIDGDSIEGELIRESGENSGIYSIKQGSLRLPEHYQIIFNEGTYTVTERPITVTADAQSKTYGDEDPVLSYVISNGSLVFDDAFTGTLDRAQGEDVGKYAIGQGTLALSSNYALSFVGADLEIGVRAVEVTADAQSKTYGDEDPVLSYVITKGSLAFDDAFTGALDRAQGEDVGKYAIGQGTLALSSNYALSFVGADLEIGVRAVEVTADAQSKTYGDEDPVLSYVITKGSLAFDDAFTGTLDRAQGEDVGKYAIGQGTLALSSNYNLSFIDSVLSIEQRSITIAAVKNQSKIIGDKEPVLLYKIASGTLVGDDNFSGELTRDPGEDVGAYSIKIGTLSLNNNYSLSFIGDKFNIYYGVHGLLEPYATPNIKAFKAGSNIPLKWQYTNYSDNTIEAKDAMPIVRARFIEADDSRVDVEEIQSPGTTGLSYHESSKTWLFNWQTKKLRPGLYEIVITSEKSGQVEVYEILLK